MPLTQCNRSNRPRFRSKTRYKSSTALLKHDYRQSTDSTNVCIEYAILLLPGFRAQLLLVFNLKPIYSNPLSVGNGLIFMVWRSGLFGDIGLIADDELPIRGTRYRGIFVDYHFVIENYFFLAATHTASRPTTGATTASPRLQ